MDRPTFLWRDVTDGELAADLEALRAGRYRWLRLAGDSAWSATQSQDGEYVLGRFHSIWLESCAGETVAIVLRHQCDRAVWQRSKLHDAGHLPSGEALLIAMEEGPMAMNDLEAIKDSVAELMRRTAEDHHVAYAATDGADPDWSIWYAGHLLELGLDTLLQARLLKSDLIYLLVLADKQQQLEAPGAAWERWYAALLVQRYVR